MSWSSNESYSGVRNNINNNDGIIQGPTPDPTAINTNTNTSSNNEAFKLYQVIIFSGPIVFILIILFLFYLFYLRRHSVDWSSLRMRPTPVASHTHLALQVIETGLKKEFREMLPIIIFKESLSVNDTQLYGD